MVLKSPYPGGVRSSELNDPFPSLATGRSGIDLRVVVNDLFTGTMIDPPQAHWVVLRRFNLSSRSEDFIGDQWKEPVGGPQWSWTDEAVLARYDSVTTGTLSRFLEQEEGPGLIHVDYRIYYFQYDASPKKEDEIYEIIWPHGIEKKPVTENIPLTDFVERFNINDSIPFRGDNGRIEYYACLCRRERAFE